MGFEVVQKASFEFSQLVQRLGLLDTHSVAVLRDGSCARPEKTELSDAKFETNGVRCSDHWMEVSMPGLNNAGREVA
jgi:hypothetical protein